MKRYRKAAFLFSLLLAFTLFALPVCAAQPEVRVELEVETQLTGDTPPSAEAFTFMLEAKDSAPMPQGSTLTITGAGTGKFAPIAYTRPGDYSYTLRELDGKAEGYYYDTRVYDVTVQVTTDDSGTLSAAVYMAREGTQGKTGKAVFVNTYTAKTVPPETPPVLPQTNDTTRNGLWVCLLVLSALGILAFILPAGNKKKQN